MPQPIFFRVGNNDRISLSGFIDALHNFLSALRNIDATISSEQRGSVTWDVTSLQKNSPPVVGVTPTPRRPALPDESYKIESQFIETLRILSERPERTPILSDSALFSIENIAKRSAAWGPSSVWLPSNGLPKLESEISATTLRNVTELTSVKFSGFGSITGKLESISVHKGAEFRVWDKQTLKPVRCKYRAELEQQIKDSLRKTVTVIGMILMNSAGNPVSMEVEEIDDTAAATASPLSIDQISGAIKHFTGGRPLREYLDETSDE
jgi:hypothetical protein